MQQDGLERIRHARALVRARACPRRTCSARAARACSQFLKILDGGRISVAAMGVGLAQGAYDLAPRYAQERAAVRPADREVPGRSQFKLADMATEIEAARDLVSRPRGRRTRAATSRDGRDGQALLRRDLRAVERALQIHGGYGFMDEYPVSRLYRDQKILEIGEGTNEVQRMVIAKKLGL